MPTPIIDAGIPAEFADYYSQKITWSACGGARTYCGTVLVPVDWRKNTGENLKLSVAYRQADSAKPLGSIIFNPGGPGTSGSSWIRDSVDQLGTADLRANYNMVGFDPRGVGDSEPKVSCYNAKQLDALLYADQEFEINSAADIEQSRLQMKDFAESCLENTGPNLQFIDTVSAAKDMDVLRAAFGDSKINYLGFSYGTYLGATYAAIYPERVGRMVLDGAINPLASAEEQDQNQLKGFSLALDNFIIACLNQTDCPLRGNLTDAQGQISELLRSIESAPLKTDDPKRELTIWAAVTGIILPLYGEDWWPTLSDALHDALKGDGTALLDLADIYNDRNSDGTYATNTLEANVAISCLDSRASDAPKQMEKLNRKLLLASSTLGRYWLNGAIGCSDWPFPLAQPPASYAATESAIILVVGTTGDPATPYEQAEQLANEVLSNAVLVTYNGEGHTAYGLESACVNSAVDDYFMKNVVPTEDPNCS